MTKTAHFFIIWARKGQVYGDEDRTWYQLTSTNHDFCASGNFQDDLKQE